MDKPKKRIGHRLAEPASSLGISILECGWSYRDHMSLIQEKSWMRETYLLVYFFDGRGKLESAHTGLVELKPGDLFIIPPGVWHRYGPETGEEWYEFWVLFEGVLAETFLLHASKGNYIKRQCMFFHMGKAHEFTSLFEAAFYHAGQNNSLKCTAAFYEIMQRIERSHSTTEEKVTNNSVRTVIEGIHSFPCREVDFEKEAAALGISYATLRKAFVKNTGMPPYKYLLNHRMQYACNLLADGRTVKETCYDIGMKDPSHFSKLFKNIIGVSPLKFIEKVSK